jgi:hypothetical protein
MGLQQSSLKKQSRSGCESTLNGSVFWYTQYF